MPDLGQILYVLDRDGALILDEGAEPARERPWPQVEKDEEVVEVDYPRLFPTKRPERDGDDFELYGDGWEPTPEDLEWVLESDEPDRTIGGLPGDADVGPPKWDVWAWYEPIHFYGPDFGIYIKESALLECARRIRVQFPGAVPGGPGRFLFAKALVRAAFATLYLHEQYHHKIESFAVRLHVVQRKPVFPAYFWPVYWQTRETDAQIEEGLANADSWFRIKTHPYKTWIGKSILDTALTYLEDSFLEAPPGYRNAQRLLAKAAFDDEQHRLLAQVQEGRTKPRRKTANDFAIATQITRGLFDITTRIYTIVRRGSVSMLPLRAAIAPLQTRKLARYVLRCGWEEVKGGDGSHKKYVDGRGGMIILPHEKEVSIGVLGNTARSLGLSAAELETEANRRR